MKEISNSSDAPERVIERRVALSTIEKVLHLLEAEAAACGKSQLFTLLQGALAGSEWTSSYAEMARLMGISDGTIKMAAYRLRQRCRELLRQEVVQTVDRPEDVDEEIRHLFLLLGG